MRCPFCATDEDKVIETRVSKDGSEIRRRRECEGCKRRFTTYERIEESMPLVIKSDGRREPFDRNKIEHGMRAAVAKRPVSTRSDCEPRPRGRARDRRARRQRDQCARRSASACCRGCACSIRSRTCGSRRSIATSATSKASSKELDALRGEDTGPHSMPPERRVRRDHRRASARRGRRVKAAAARRRIHAARARARGALSRADLAESDRRLRDRRCARQGDRRRRAPGPRHDARRDRCAREARRQGAGRDAVRQPRAVHASRPHAAVRAGRGASGVARVVIGTRGSDSGSRRRHRGAAPRGHHGQSRALRRRVRRGESAVPDVGDAQPAGVHAQSGDHARRQDRDGQGRVEVDHRRRGARATCIACATRTTPCSSASAPCSPTIRG